MRKKLNFDWNMLGIIFALAWPTMLEQLMQTAVQYIDTAMVGSLGTEATAAVGATSTVSWMVMSVVGATGVGFLANIAQSYGAGEYRRMKEISAQAVTVTVLLGAFLSALLVSLSSRIPVWMQVDPSIRDLAGKYFLIVYIPMLFRTTTIIFGTLLRAAGDTKTPMRVGIAMNIVNVILNALLIYPTGTICVGRLRIWGAGWGVLGAADASAVSYVIGGIAVAAALWKHPLVSPKGMSFLPRRDVMMPCAKIALPNMFQRFGTSLGYVVFASMINSLGGLSTAAHTIANTVESAFYIPGWGMQAAAATLAGNAIGAKDPAKRSSLGRTIVPLEVGLMILSGGLLFAFAEPLVMIFSRDAQVIALGTTVLRMVALSEPFYGVPIVVEGMMQGSGKTLTPLVYNLSGMWGVRIAGTFLCTQILGMGLVSAWACMIGHNLLLFFLFGKRYIAEYR